MSGFLGLSCLEKKNVNVREGDKNTQAVETNLPVALLQVEVKGLFAFSVTHVQVR